MHTTAKEIIAIKIGSGKNQTCDLSVAGQHFLPLDQHRIIFLGLDVTIPILQL